MKRRGTRLALALGALSLTLLTTSHTLAQRGGGRGGPPPEPGISNVAGDVYKVETGPGVSATTVFMVTPEGIVLADPLNPDFAAWFRAETAERFGVPVRYVVNSHYHWDHARGGGMFADTATYIAHEDMPRLLDDPSFRTAPPPGPMLNLSSPDRLAEGEATGGTRGRFSQLDNNVDGFLTRPELTADIRRPDIVFLDRYTIELGGKKVELIEAGGRHTADMIDLYFPEEKVLFAGDYIWIGRICCNFAFDRMGMDRWIDSIRSLEELDFDIIVNSHYRQGTKSDVIEFREWLENLRDEVSEGIAAGRSLEELQETITMDAYRDWESYQSLPDVIASAYQSLTMYP